MFKTYPGIGDSCEQIHGSNTLQISAQSSARTTEIKYSDRESHNCFICERALCGSWGFRGNFTIPPDFLFILASHNLSEFPENFLSVLPNVLHVFSNRSPGAYLNF